MSERRRPPAALLFLVIVINTFVADSLVCHPTEYEVNGECCPMCPAGSRVKIDCTEFRSTSCLPCMEGTFTEKPNGLKRCWSCTICDSGSGLTVKKRCTATSDTVCEPLEGFLCTDRTKDNGCAATGRHRSCEPGQYIHQKGTAFTDTQCSACSDGTFSNGSSTTCQPHTQCEELNLLQVTAGTPSADAQCGKLSLPGAIIPVGLSLLVLLATVSIVGGVIWLKRKTVPQVIFGYCANLIVSLVKAAVGRGQQVWTSHQLHHHLHMCVLRPLVGRGEDRECLLVHEHTY